MDRRSAKLLNFVLSHQFVFEAIKRAHDEPTDENITDMQEAIQNMVENERSDAYQTLILGSQLLALPHGRLNNSCFQ